MRLTGDYPSWADALQHAEGYDADAILATARRAALAVRRGEAAFDRDGVAFKEAAPPFPLLAGLLRAAARDRGALRVLDFGGALGSTYMQCRQHLSGLASLRWEIVEQDHLVDCGREEFADGVLGFSPSIADARAMEPNVVLLSGVLQYVPEPAAVIREIVSLRPATIIIDRLPLVAGTRNVIAVQHVSRRIVRSSYPVWLFARTALFAEFGDLYRVLAEFDAVDGRLGGVLRPVDFKGFILEASQ